MNIILFDNYSDLYKCDKIICLSHFSLSELHLLIQSLKDVQKGNVVVLSEQPYIYYKEIRLELRLSSIDYGISQNNEMSFVCNLSASAYENAINLIQHLLQNEMNGFQWLYDIDTSIEFLLSKDAKW